MPQGIDHEQHLPIYIPPHQRVTFFALDDVRAAANRIGIAECAHGDFEAEPALLLGPPALGLVPFVFHPYMYIIICIPALLKPARIEAKIKKSVTV
jgi:hypothetical protein